MAANIPIGPKGEKRRVAFNVIEDLGVAKPGVVLPPLYMQYNPQSWDHNFKKIITRCINRFFTIEYYVCTICLKFYQPR